MLDLDARLKTWLSRADIAGSSVRLAALPRRSIGFTRARSTADVTLMDVPSYVGGEVASVDAGWNGLTERFFTGIVDGSAANRPSLSRTVKLVDILGKLRSRFTVDINWADRSFMDACFDVFIQAGIDTYVSYVYDPGEDYILGTEETINIKANESPAQVISQLMEYAGTVIWCTPDGTIRVDLANPIPSATYATLPNGDDIVYAAAATGTELGYTSAGWDLPSPERLISSVTITGPTLSSGITPTGNATLDTEGQAYSANLRFVQRAATAQAIAERELDRRAVNRRTLRYTAPHNPYVLPGLTHGVRDTLLGLTSTTPVVVWDIDSTGEQQTVTCYEGAHHTNGYNTLQAPRASFVMTIEKEQILISGNTTTVYMVQCDATASYDPDGQIVTYTWTATGASPATFSGATPMFVFSALPGSTITLTVTDDQGQTGTVTKNLAEYASTVVYRILSVAEGTAGWSVLDQGDTWRNFTRASRTCTAVPTFNERGPMVCGWDDGLISTSSNVLATAPPALVTLTGGSIGCVFVNEGDYYQVLAAAGPRLHRSTNGTTFSQKYIAAAAINDIQSSPQNVNEIAIAYSNLAARSFDGGTTFTTYITGAGGTVCRMLASAPWGHLAVFTGGAAVADAVKSEEGYTFDWTAIGTPPTSLRVVYPFLKEEAFVVGDGTGKLWKLTKSGSTLTAAAITTITGTPSIDDGIRDGALAGLAFLATSGGTKKLINATTVYDVRATASVQVGYGKMGTLTATTTTVVSTAGSEKALSTGTADTTPTDSSGRPWYAHAFDDSAWTPSVAYPSPFFAPLAGSTAIWWQPSNTPDERVLFRRAFTLPPGAISAATLALRADNYIELVYVNGVALSSSGTFVAGPEEVTISDSTLLSALRPGESNVLAFKALNDPTTIGAVLQNTVSYKLTTNPNGSSSGATTNSGSGAKWPSMALDTANSKSYYSWSAVSAAKVATGTLIANPTGAVTVGSVGGNPGYFNTATAADASGYLHLAWIDGGTTIRAAKKLHSASAWPSPVTVATGLDFANGVDIAASSASNLAIIWRTGAGTLHFSRSSDGGATWGAATVVTGATTYAGKARLAPGNRDHLAFGNSTGGIQAGAWGGANYTLETVAAGGAGDEFRAQPSIVRTSGGTRYVSYRRTGGGVYVSTNSGGGWSEASVDSSTAVGPVAIALTSGGDPVLAFSTGAMVYTRSYSGGWGAATSVSIGSGAWKTNIDLAIATSTKHIVIEDWPSGGSPVIAYARV